MTRAAKINTTAPAAAAASTAKANAKPAAAQTHASHADEVKLPPDWKPTWARAFVGFVGVMLAAAGIGAVFGALSAALVSAAAVLTTSAFAAMAIEFIMAILMFATLALVSVKLWDGVMSGSIERRAAEGWSDVKGWFAMRRALKAAA